MQMGRRVASHLEPTGAQTRVHHGSHAALAIGASHHDRTKGSLGISTLREGALHAPESQLYSAGRQRVEIARRLRVAHEAQSSRCASRRAMFARIIFRSLIKSIMPCSTRNSERWKPSGSFWRIVFSITRGPAKPIRA